MNAPRPKIQQIVTDAQEGQPLDYVVAEVASVSDDEATALITRGAVWLNRLRAQQHEVIVSTGDQLTIHFPPSGSYDIINITAADIVWEDAALLALNKQAGWHANYTPWDVRGSIPYALNQFLRARDGKEPHIHLAHQLDRDTSGVLLISKTPTVNPELQRLFVTGNIAKTYLALASGLVEQPVFEVETGHGRGAGGRFRVYRLDEVGHVLPFGNQRVRSMQTRFNVLAHWTGTDEAATLLQATPITGRTHQIRLHLAHVCHPIIGDARYNGPVVIHGEQVEHHLLHAARLEFLHPITRQTVSLVAPLPATWNRVLSRLGLQANV